jgi:PTS system mannose-specific IIB component/fructoselysine and glucoselysine-specific PTS system IIB component
VPIVLHRVDERLIHGQVVIGWGHELRPDRYLLVDDELAASDWEQELYRLGAVGAQVVFASLTNARELIAEWRADSERSILLTRDIGTMRRLAEGGGLEGGSVNLGGIHHAQGRVEILPYLHLTEEDRADILALMDEGLTVVAQDLPDAAKVGLPALLSR